MIVWLKPLQRLKFNKYYAVYHINMHFKTLQNYTAEGESVTTKLYQFQIERQYMQ